MNYATCKVGENIPNKINNFTCSGKCSNCGACCSDLLPVSESEINSIKKYIKSHNIKRKLILPLSNKTINMVCPFRDEQNKKCLIYEARPEICRSFICSKSKPEIEDAKRLYNSTRNIISMSEVFFNDPSVINYVKQCFMNFKEKDYGNKKIN